MAYDPRSFRTTGTDSSSGGSSSGSHSSGSRGGGSRNHYGFIRSTDRWGVNSIPWEDIIASGLMPTFASNDPHLAQAMAAAKEHGVNAGIWIPAGGEGLPEQYAQTVVDLYKKYGPAALIPNIETAGKGYSGSKGWDWNQRMVNELTRLGVPPNLAIAVTGEKDFNYGAYTNKGIGIVPEMFGADPGKDLWDVQTRHDDLVKLGVPESLISDLLAPSQVGNHQGSVFTLDDLTPEQIKALKGSGGSTPMTTTSNATTSDDSGGDMYGYTEQPPDNSAGYEQVPDNTSGGFVQVGGGSAAARRYAQMRLQALRSQGIRPEDYGLSGLDPAAQWRALSSIVGAQQAISAGNAGGYHLGANVPPAVAAYVQKLLDAAMTNGGHSPDDAIAPGGAGGSATAAPYDFRDNASLEAGAASGRDVGMFDSGVAGDRAVATTPFQLLGRPSRATPGQLQNAVRRLGPMQGAIHTAAGLAHLRRIIHSQRNRGHG